MNKKIKAIIVLGPTASGKTSLAVNLANKFSGEIVSADSRQVYKYLDIGTGKDLQTYKNFTPPINHHLIDIVSPFYETYNLRSFYEDAQRAIWDINERKLLPIVAGGSPLYLDSLISGYKFPKPPPDNNLRERFKDKPTEEIALYLKENYFDIYKQIDNLNSRPRLIRTLEEIESNSPPKPEVPELNVEWLLLGIYYPRNVVHERIKKRLLDRLDNGLIEEVKSLHSKGLSWKRLDEFGLEYRYVSKYLQGEMDLNEMIDALLVKIRRFAKSQDAWFRKIERKGYNIYWLKGGDLKKAEEYINNFLNDKKLPSPELKLSNTFYGPKSSKKSEK